MLYSSFPTISFVLTDKQIPVPSIGLQPTIILPPKTPASDKDLCWYSRNHYSLNFSIDYHFNESTNTMEMIKQNFDFSEGPKIVLKRYLSKSSGAVKEGIFYASREILLPTTTISKGLYRMFVQTGPYSGTNPSVMSKVGCQMISLYMDNKPDGVTLPLEQMAFLLEIDKELFNTNTDFGFQFFVTLKKDGCFEDEEPYITISSDVFRIYCNKDFSEIKCLKVYKGDYFHDEDELGLEVKRIEEELVTKSGLEEKKLEKDLVDKLVLEKEEIEQKSSPALLPQIDDSNNGENPITALKTTPY